MHAADHKERVANPNEEELQSLSGSAIWQPWRRQMRAVERRQQSACNASCTRTVMVAEATTHDTHPQLDVAGSHSYRRQSKRKRGPKAPQNVSALCGASLRGEHHDHLAAFEARLALDLRDALDVCLHAL